MEAPQGCSQRPSFPRGNGWFSYQPPPTSLGLRGRSQEGECGARVSVLRMGKAKSWDPLGKIDRNRSPCVILSSQCSGQVFAHTPPSWRPWGISGILVILPLKPPGRGTDSKTATWKIKRRKFSINHGPRRKSGNNTLLTLVLCEVESLSGSLVPVRPRCWLPPPCPPPARLWILIANLFY